MSETGMEVFPNGQVPGASVAQQPKPRPPTVAHSHRVKVWGAAQPWTTGLEAKRVLAEVHQRPDPQQTQP